MVRRREPPLASCFGFDAWPMSFHVPHVQGVQGDGALGCESKLPCASCALKPQAAVWESGALWQLAARMICLKLSVALVPPLCSQKWRASQHFAALPSLLGPRWWESSRWTGGLGICRIFGSWFRERTGFVMDCTSGCGSTCTSTLESVHWERWWCIFL